jgi:hypothetical protein
MRLTVLSSAVITFLSTAPSGSLLASLTAPEPLWLALWGFGLIGLSTLLRSAVRRTQVAPITKSSAQLDTMQPTFVRSA